MNEDRVQTGQGILAGKLFAIAVVMFGFGFALVPLYDVFCDLTGLNGKVGVEAASDLDFEVDPSREVTLELVTSVNGSTPMDFKAETVKIRVHPGKFYTVYFTATNRSDRKLMAQAIPSFTPGLAAKYLKKTECFCFDQQIFEAGQTLRMPVQFVIDPEIPDDYKDVTLAYTFFDVTDKKI